MRRALRGQAWRVGASPHESVEAGAGKLTEVAFVGAVVGQTTVVGGGVPPGLVVKRSGIVQPAPIIEPVEPKYWNGRRTAGVVIAGVGAVGMVVGAVFGAERGSETSDANADAAKVKGGAGVPASSLCANPSAANASACSSLSSARSSNSTDAHVEGAFLVGGGVLLGVGLITTFWPSGPEPVGIAAKLTPTPMTGPHLAGLQWSGSF